MFRRPIRTGIASGSGSLSQPTRRSTVSAAWLNAENGQRDMRSPLELALSRGARPIDVATAEEVLGRRDLTTGEPVSQRRSASLGDRSALRRSLAARATTAMMSGRKII